MINALFATGFVSIGAQVVILRELNVAFYGVELIYLIAFAAWLMWTAVGAFVSLRSRVPTQRTVAVFFAVMALVIPAVTIFLRGVRILFGAVPGAYLSLFQQISAVSLSTMPAALLTGMLFSWAARIYIAEASTQRSLAGAYAIESGGGLVGGLAATLSLSCGIQNVVMGILCSLMSCVAALAVSLFSRDYLPIWRRREIYLSAIVGLSLATVLLTAREIDLATSRWNHPGITTVKDTAYGRIIIEKHGKGTSQVCVFENDALVADSEGVDAEIFCHLAALQHPRPSKVLILGGGHSGLVREILKHAPLRIDYIELNPLILTLTSASLRDDMGAAMAERRLSMIPGDPRRYLDGSVAYDLILVGMAEPTSAQANRFYTKEFFSLCSRSLMPGGVLAIRLQGSENFWTPPLTMKMTSVNRALRSVFPHVLFLPGSTNVITASHNRLPEDPEILHARWHERGIENRFVDPAYIKYVYSNDRLTETSKRLAETNAPLNRDIRPVSFRYTAFVWLSKFIPAVNTKGFIEHFERASVIGLFILILFLTGPAAAVAFYSPSTRPILIAALAGFTGMVTETVLIMYYQVKQGALYQDIGLLLMSFMAGLTFGSWSLRHGASPSPLLRTAILTANPLFAALMAVAVINGCLYELGYIMFFLALGGFLVGGIFATVCSVAAQEPRKAVGLLYGADILGGSASALLCGLVLVPLFGLDIALLVAFFAALLPPIIPPFRPSCTVHH